MGHKYNGDESEYWGSVGAESRKGKGSGKEMT
jgi:hypothetical protein